MTLGQRTNRFTSTAIILAMVALLLPVMARTAEAATPVELFFSEYVEGSSFNKAVEIYNGTGGPVDLGAGTYTMELYSNGSVPPSATVALSGIVADGDVFVLSHGSASAGIQAQTDLTSSAVMNFNGDDGVVLRKGGVVVDAFGQNAVDPGSQWPGGGQNDTLRRKAAVCAGDTNFADAFTAATEWDVFAQDDVTDLGAHSVTCGGGGPSDPVINEYVANHTGADSQAFVEVFGDASTDYSAFTVLEIEGDTSTGVIDAALPVGTTNAGGYWIDSEDMENGTITILLVEGFTGSVGNDIDADDNSAIDFTPWTRIVDDVAVTDGGASDLTYSSTVLAAGFDGAPFGPGGASRISNGTDTDATADWTRNDFDGFGFPTFPGSPALGEAENTPDEVNVAITVLTDPIGVCTDPATFIHDIQGAGLVSTDVGNIREIEGVVVGDFQGSAALNGFNVQEEDSDVDGDALTSEGIFVFDPANAVALNAGDVVRVRGAVAEFNSLTEINNVQTVIDCNATDTATASTVTLPVAAIDDFEPTEGMAVDFPQTLFASGNFTQGRFGEVDLSVGAPLDNPTNVTTPGAAANALQALNDRSRIQLDDGSNVQNPLPLPPYLGAGGTLRTGDSLAGVTGVLGFAFGSYEIHPTGSVSFTRVNVRPAAPPAVGGRLQVAAFNVLNYFTTIDNAGPICGPSGDQGCRGADTPAEFTRQRDKIIGAIVTLDADVVGLMEIENPSDTPLDDLVSGLNAVAGAKTYRAIKTGAIGTDAIAVAFIYKPGSVTPVARPAILDSSVDPTFNDDKNRPALAQTFLEKGTGSKFTVAVNHFKSKGSPCDDVGDPNADDGQGNCNGTRTDAANALVNWLSGDPTNSRDPDFLIIGDLNSYAMEDPITAIEGAGYTDLVEFYVGTGFAAGAYSFNFFSQSGYLDHSLANPSLVSQVTGATFWHTNADEPSALDYNNFNQPDLYNPDPFRASDHDAVVIGLNLHSKPPK